MRVRANDDDALIATHILGWKRGKRFANGNGEWDLPDGNKRYWEHTPQFSTIDQAALILVVKATYCTIDKKDNQYTCQIEFNARTPHGVGRATTFAQAVSTAALHWIYRNGLAQEK